MRIIPAVLIAVLVIATFQVARSEDSKSRPAIGQTTTVTVPKEYSKILDDYRGWTPDDKDWQYSDSLMNWALHARFASGETLVTAARNWLFTRSEKMLTSLAQTHADDLRTVFGPKFNDRGLHLVFSRPYNDAIDSLYRRWYSCIGKLEVGNFKVNDRVLSYVVYSNLEETEKFAKSCTAEMKSLTDAYGTDALSPDELTAIGFLSRRYAAHTRNARFVSAEFIRKLVHDVFDPDQN